VVDEVELSKSEPYAIDDSLNFPIALRKKSRARAGKPPERYMF
jgi:hypothetical protein